MFFSPRGCKTALKFWISEGENLSAHLQLNNPSDRYVPTDAVDCKRQGDKTGPNGSARDPDREVAPHGSR